MRGGYLAQVLGAEAGQLCLLNWTPRGSASPLRGSARAEGEVGSQDRNQSRREPGTSAVLALRVFKTLHPSPRFPHALSCRSQPPRRTQRMSWDGCSPPWKGRRHRHRHLRAGVRWGPSRVHSAWAGSPWDHCPRQPPRLPARPRPGPLPVVPGSASRPAESWLCVEPAG